MIGRGRERQIRGPGRVQSPRLIVIAGMHRSGTSLLAQLVHGLGAPLGDQVERYPVPSNLSGHWEDAGAWRAAERLLGGLGQRWGAASAPLPPRWTEWPEAAVARQAFTDLARHNLAKAPIWAVKDPRATRCLPLWADAAVAVGARLVVLVMLRPASAVVRSLASRDGADPVEAERSWRQFNTELVAFSHHTPVLFVSYDDLLANGLAVAGQVARHCGLADDSTACQRAVAFINTGLRHNAPSWRDPRTASRIMAGLAGGDPPSAPQAPMKRPMRLYLTSFWNEAHLLRALRSVLGQTHQAWTLFIVAPANLLSLIEASLAPYGHLLAGRLTLVTPQDADPPASADEILVVGDEFDVFAPGFLAAVARELTSAGAALMPEGKWLSTLPEGGDLRLIAEAPTDAQPADWPCAAHGGEASGLQSRNIADTLSAVRRQAATTAATLPGHLVARERPVVVAGAGGERFQVMAVGEIEARRLLEDEGATHTLEVLAGPEIEQAGSVWIGRGQDPQLHFAIAGRGANLGLGSGLYLLCLTTRAVGNAPRMRIYARADDHFSEAQCALLPSEAGGTQGVLINAPAALAGLRLDPAEGLPVALEVGHATLRRLSAPLPWLMAPRRAARLPDVLCIGAQKAGTTWLHQTLQAVPGIWASPVKEFHQFDDPWGQNSALQAARQTTALEILSAADTGYHRLAVNHAFPAERGWGAYLNLFAEVPEDRKVLDFTPAYATLDDSQVAMIARHMPHVKVLFILRDPVERSLSGAFHEARVRGLPPTRDSITELTRSAGNSARTDYLATLERWRRHFPGDQLCVLYHDDLLWDPAAFLKKACTFIGVDPGAAINDLDALVNPGTAEQEAASLAPLKAELSMRFLPMLGDLSRQLGGPCVQWLAAANARIAAALGTAAGAGAGPDAAGDHSVRNNLAQWNDIHPWPLDGDEWSGQAAASALDYGHWKAAVMARYAPVLAGAEVILEIGPGRGRWSGWLASLAPRLVLVDIAPNCLDACRRKLMGRVGLRTHVSTGADLPHDLDGCIGGLWSFDCFVHLDEETTSAYLAEVARVLRPGAHAIIHHGDAATRPAGMDHGWRSQATARLVVACAMAHGLQVVVQERVWENGVGVPRFNDMISVLRRPA